MKKLNLILLILTVFAVFTAKAQSSCQAYFAYYPDSINMGEPGPYAFFDYSQNMDSTQINVVSWNWTVSGGGTTSTSNVQNPVFYFNSTGYYNVCLSIWTVDSCYSSYCDSLVINGANPCDIVIDYNYVMPSGPNSADGSIDITVSGGTPPYQYIWDNGVSTQDLNQLPAGVYTVNVYDNNQCSQTISVSLMDSSSTSLFAYTEVYNETSYGACDGMIAVYPSGGTSPYQYVWSNGATTQYIDSLCSGTYDVTVYDAMQNSFVTNAYVYYDSTNTGGCYSSFYYDVNTNAQNPLTTYNFYDYSSPDAISWSWSFGDGATSIEQNPMHVFPDTGVYSVCLTIYTLDSCVNTYCDNIFISGDSIIINPCNMYVYGYATNCSGANIADGSIDITVTGGTSPYSYNWTGGNGNTYATEDLLNISVGNYYVEVYDANGCIAYQQFFVNYGNDSTICNFYAYSNVTPVSYIGANDGVIDVTVVGGVAPFSYLWNNGATTEDLIGVSSGTYVLTIYSADSLCPAITLTANVYEPYDTNGGVIIDSLYTNSVDTCFISSVDSFFVSGVNVNNNNSITVTWEFVVGSVTYIIDATYTCSASGNYVIYLTINCGSNKALTTYMTYIHTEITTAYPVLTNEVNISLYPNPVNEKLNIKLSNLETTGANLNIYNISGQVVYSNDVINSLTEVNTSDFSKGVYVVKIVSNNNQYISKFIK